MLAIEKAAAALQRADSALAKTGFDPSEPRDPHGKWTTGGGAAYGSGPSSHYQPAWEKISHEAQLEQIGNRILEDPGFAARYNNMPADVKRQSMASWYENKLRGRTTTSHQIKDISVSATLTEEQRRRREEANRLVASGQANRQQQANADAMREKYAADYARLQNNPGLRRKLAQASHRLARTTESLHQFTTSLNQAIVTSDYDTAARNLKRAYQAVGSMKSELTGIPEDVKGVRAEIKLKIRQASAQLKAVRQHLSAKLASIRASMSRTKTKAKAE
jgi:hypothetical protein